MTGKHKNPGAHSVALQAAFYGPHSDLVLRFLEDVRRPRLWTERRIRLCRPAGRDRLRHAAARRATRRATRLLEDRDAQRAAALNRAWDEAAVHENTTERCGWAAGWAAAALTVIDLIDTKHLYILTKPFPDLMVRYGFTPHRGPLPTSALPAPPAPAPHGEHVTTTTKTAAAKPPAELRAYRKLTQEELAAEAAERFGPNPRDWAFQCPRCGDIAVVGDFPKGEEGRIGQECVGRWRGALHGPANADGGRAVAERGCDWTAYGLIRGPWEIVMPDGHSAWGFPLAPANQAMRGTTARLAGATCVAAGTGDEQAGATAAPPQSGAASTATEADGAAA